MTNFERITKSPLHLAYFVANVVLSCRAGLCRRCPIHMADSIDCMRCPKIEDWLKEESDV